MDTRIAVVAVVIMDRQASAPMVNQILSQYGEIIVGRMGIPYREKNLSVIALIVDGSTDELGAMTGKLGRIPGVRVKTAMAT
ncbi:MAG: TM1266 family iron-only hydrogenase system putative regulator [Chloroflexota bacterium]|jgi:putative iron-only hydrogenase system regulator